MSQVLRRGISCFLLWAMVLTMVPVQALAAGADVSEEPQMYESGQEAGGEDVVVPMANVSFSSLGGTVTDTGGGGLAGVSVQIYDVDENAVLTSCTTGADGTWASTEYEVMSGGSYVVRYYKAGYTFDANRISCTAAEGGTELEPVTAAAVSGLACNEADYTYEAVTGGVAVTGYTGAHSAIRIPNTLGGEPVVAINRYAFRGCAGLTAVCLPDGLTRIGFYAFDGCTGLESLTGPNSLEAIESGAFRGCESLAAVDLPDGVTELASYAFQGCASLNSFTYPRGWTGASSGIFAGCTALTSIAVPDGVTAIPNYAFQGADCLERVSLPDTVTVIGSSAFRNCTALEDIGLPGRLETISDYAFAGCTALGNPTYPNGLAAIGVGAFQGCTGFTAAALPDSVTEIGSYAFRDCANLSSFTYPKSWAEAGTGIFKGCTALTSITVPNGVLSVPNYAFSGANCLEQVSLPTTLASIGVSAFADCGKLESPAFPAGLAVIGDSAFSGCASLTAANLPDSVTEIGTYAFRNCTDLSSFTYPKGWTDAGGRIFAGCTALTSITVPEGVTTLPDSAFYGADCLQVVRLPAGLTSIGSSAFSNCTILENVDLPDSLATLGQYAFSACKGLTEVAFPASVTSIGYRAFSDCTGLRTITYPAGLTSSGGDLFRGCVNLTSITVPEGVTALPQNALSGLDCLQSVRLPSTLETVGDSAFARCTALVQLALPDSVTAVGGSAFSGCTKLERLWLGENVTAIGQYAVSSCPELTIHGVAGSYAQEYAQANGIPFSTEPLEAGLAALSGRVLDKAGAGVSGVSVSLRDETAGEYVSAGLVTDGTGSWTAENVKIGNIYTVRYYKAGYTFTPNPIRYTVPQGGGAVETATADDSALGSAVCNEGDYTYQVANGAAKITGYTGKDAVIRIPDTLGGAPVTAIGDNAFRACTGLTAVYLPDNLTSIGSYAFFGCTGLEDITYPNGLNVIGFGAFQNCTSLTAANLPDCVTEIGGYAFRDCANLSSFTYPKSWAEAGTGIFKGCTALTAATVPEGITAIPNYAFQGADGLKTVELPSTLVSIGVSAFADCGKLENPLFPATLTTIGSSAFSGCASLTAADLPDSVTEIGTYAFRNCTSLSSFTYPKGWTEAGSQIFAGCTTLTSITVPDGVTALPDNAFYGSDCLQEVGLPAGLTSIGMSAFSNCTILENVDLPDSLTTLGQYAFSACKAFTQVQFPAGVKKIGYRAFSDCTGLRTITYPAGLTSSGGDLFRGCVNLTSITVPEGVTALPQNALSGLDCLQSVSLPSTLETVGDSAFARCTALVQLALPDSVTAVGGSAFSGCTKLERLWLGENVTTIGQYAVSSCPELTIHGVAGSYAQEYAQANGIPFSTEPLEAGLAALSGRVLDKAGAGVSGVSVSLRDETAGEYVSAGLVTDGTGSWTAENIKMGSIYTVRYYKAGYTFTPNPIRYTVPQGGGAVETATADDSALGSAVCNEGDYTYEVANGAAKITEYTGKDAVIRIPDTLGGAPVTAIGDNAFRACTGLTAVYLPDNLTSIGSYAFLGCTGLESITYPNGLTAIGVGAFRSCSALTAADLPDSVREIGGYAYQNCTALSSFTYPKSWAEAGTGIFKGCTALTAATVPEGITAIPNYAFSGADGLKTVKLPSTLVSIGVSAFADCGKLESPAFPAGLSVIGDSAFSGCASLTAANLPDSVTEIGTYAFRNCTDLSSFTYPKGWTDAGGRIFAGCTALTSVTVPDGVTVLPDSAFYGADCLKEVRLPAGLTAIGMSAFSNCTILENVDLPDSLTTMGQYAFSACKGLTEVAFPASVKSIGYRAFSDCTGLRTVTYPAGLTSSGGDLFQGCVNLTAITVPEGVTALPKNALSGLGSLRSVSLPSTLETVGDSAFARCTQLRYVELPTGVTALGNYAFSGCTQLRLVYFPHTIQSFGYDLFQGSPRVTVECREYSPSAIHCIDEGIPVQFIGESFESGDGLGLDRSATYYVGSTAAAQANGYLTMNLSYRWKDGVEVTGQTLTIRIPANTLLLEQTVELDGAPLTGYEYEDNLLTISLDQPAGSLSFSLRPTADGAITSYAVLDFTCDGRKEREVVGIINEEMPLLTLFANDQVNTDQVEVSGVGPAASDITLLVDGQPAGTVRANRAGSYTGKVTLPSVSDYAAYTITAQAVSPAGGEISASKEVTYSVAAPVLQSFTVGYGSKAYDAIALGATMPILTFASADQLKFDVKFSNPEQVERVYICSTRSGVTKRMEATWDASTNSFRAQGHFDPTNTGYVPGSITVEYTQPEETISFAQGVDYTAPKYTNGVSAPIKAALSGKVQDCVEDLQSTDNQLSGVIKLVDADAQLDFNILTDILPSYLDPENAGQYGYEAVADDYGAQLYLKVAEYAEDTVRGEILDFAQDKVTTFLIKGKHYNAAAGVDDYFSFMDALGYTDTLVTWNNNRVSLKEAKQAVLASDMTPEQQAQALWKLEVASKSNNGVVAAMALQIILQAAGIAIPFPANLILPLLSMRQSAYVQDVLGQFGFLDALGCEGLLFSFRWVIDPSGYVYDGATGQRLEGVTASVYWIPFEETDENTTPADTEFGTLWDASQWNQINPILTDSQGRYAWDVPEGWWRVKYEKEGYQTVWSHWMTVPPVQTDVNIGMTPSGLGDYTVTAADTDGGSTLTLQYNGTSAADLRFLAAAYDGEGRLVAVRTAQASLETGERLTLELAYPSGQVSQIKAFVLNSQSLAPLRQVFSQSV